MWVGNGAPSYRVGTAVGPGFRRQLVNLLVAGPRRIPPPKLRRDAGSWVSALSRGRSPAVKRAPPCGGDRDVIPVTLREAEPVCVRGAIPIIGSSIQSPHPGP